MNIGRSFSTRERGSLSANKLRLLNEVLPRFIFTQNAIRQISAPISLEIGFGDGANLFNLAQKNPQEVFIGSEPYRGGIIKLLSKIEAERLKNILIWPHDVNLLLNQVPEGIFKKVYILFPDPWPKKRHKKRRLVNANFLELINSKLECQGELYFASDSSDYCAQVKDCFTSLNWTCAISDPYSGYTPTKYHQKATSSVSFLHYKKAS